MHFKICVSYLQTKLLYSQNVFQNVDTYISWFRQIYFKISTNVFQNLNTNVFTHQCNLLVWLLRWSVAVWVASDAPFPPCPLACLPPPLLPSALRRFVGAVVCLHHLLLRFHDFWFYPWSKVIINTNLPVRVISQNKNTIWDRCSTVVLKVDCQSQRRYNSQVLKLAF